MCWVSGTWAATKAGDALIDELTSPKSFLAVSLSPDGQRLAAIGFNGFGKGLFVGDTATLNFKLIVDSRRVDTLNYRYVRNPEVVRWIDGDLLAVDFNDNESESVDLVGNKVANLGASYVGRLAKEDPTGPQVLIFTDAERQSLAAINPRTGKRSRYEKMPPGQLLDGAFDAQGELRAATTSDTTFWTEKTTVRQWYRTDAQSDWQLLQEGPVTAAHWKPLYVPAEADSIVVRSRQGRDTSAIFRYDTRKRLEVELMAGHPTEDIVHAAGLGNEIFQRVVTNGLKPQTHWFDSRWASLQATVDKAVPNRVNSLSGDPRGNVLVYSQADVDPGRWCVLDTVAMTLKEVAQFAPHLQPEAMRPMQTLRYAARDGLMVPAYLTLPQAAGPQPLVVLIHGGPAARDYWAWDAEVQLLASQGYVVFQPQFRGSTGFGAAFEQAGYSQWGLAMQDDVTDGVRYLVEQKIADPSRICIYGASYGGYAALWGLVKTPELYRCGISFAGVTDVDVLLSERSDINRNPATRELARFQLGTTAAGKRQFDAVSPLQHADRINVPVLLAHGDRDMRVPMAHGSRMAEALKANGKTYQWMVFEREGHGLVYVNNQRKYFRALLDFLDENIGSHAAARAVRPEASMLPANKTPAAVE